MPRPLLLIDLDRTLFDTDKFIVAIWDFAEVYYGISADKERARASNYYDHYGDMYDYKFFDHLQAVAGSGYSRSEFIAAAAAKLSGNFLYDDATIEVIDLIDAIVTFGNRDYQTFKLLLCPQLASIERHFLLEPKGQYIRRIFAQPTLLVDDKHLDGEIHEPCVFVRIDRTSRIAKSNQGIITSLSQVPALVHTLSSN
ncbi:hypothetical protein H7142_00125 [Candidatus Saccharibacteria bacterium]|nr:hypothetical protein [Candidatus Saccharibacteria bacterium]